MWNELFAAIGVVTVCWLIGAVFGGLLGLYARARRLKLRMLEGPWWLALRSLYALMIGVLAFAFADLASRLHNYGRAVHRRAASARLRRKLRLDD